MCQRHDLQNEHTVAKCIEERLGPGTRREEGGKKEREGARTGARMVVSGGGGFFYTGIFGGFFGNK